MFLFIVADMMFGHSSLSPVGAIALCLLASSEAKVISTGLNSEKHSSSRCSSHAITSAETTFSIPTASTAPSTASLPTVDNGKDYINYTTVTGFFLQDINTTVASTFDYVGLHDAFRARRASLTIHSRLPSTSVSSTKLTALTRSPLRSSPDGRDSTTSSSP